MLTALLLFAENGQKPEADPGGMFTLPIMIGLMFLLFYLLMIRPARRKEKEQREMLSNNLKKNVRVITNFGVIGTVANIKDEEVTLKLDEGRMRVLKSTIARILGDEEPGKDAKEPSKG
jgi:preprotein translocase subunit YajC